MNPGVLIVRHTYKVRRVIVERVAVFVMNMMSAGDGSVSGLPDFLVKTPNALTTMPAMRHVIGPLSMSLCIGVSIELDAVEYDGVSVRFHA